MLVLPVELLGLFLLSGLWCGPQGSILPLLQAGLTRWVGLQRLHRKGALTQRAEHWDDFWTRRDIEGQLTNSAALF